MSAFPICSILINGLFCLLLCDCVFNATPWSLSRFHLLFVVDFQYKKTIVIRCAPDCVLCLAFNFAFVLTLKLISQL